MGLKEFRFEIQVQGAARVYAKDKKEAKETMEHTNIMACGNKMIHPVVEIVSGPTEIKH